ncbi:WD40-repeat-containing domain protein, partial [Blastocladiella britannica]
MLHKTNLLAFVSGTKRKRVVLHDDLKRRPVGSFDTAYPIARLILRRDAVVLLSTHALAVHLLRPPNQKVYELPLANTTLLAASCSWAPRFVVACETQQRGAVQVLDLTALVGNAASSAAAASPLPPPPSSSSATVGVLPSSAVRLIRAHDSPVAALAVSPDAARVATASGRGTLIRVWDAASGALVRELRRGVDAAAIQSLSFSSDAARLVVVSDKATVHVFNI